MKRMLQVVSLVLCNALSHYKEKSQAILVERGFIECSMIKRQLYLHLLLLCPDMILIIGMSVTSWGHCIAAFATCCTNTRPDTEPLMWPTLWFLQQRWLAVQVICRIRRTDFTLCGRWHDLAENCITLWNQESRTRYRHRQTLGVEPITCSIVPSRTRRPCG